MSRRIQTVPATEEGALFLGAAPDNQNRGDDYLDRLVKYIPAEIIALYLGASNVVPHSGRKNEVIALWVIAVLTTICTPIYMRYATKDWKTQPTLWSQVIISSIAFPIWVFAMGGPFEATWPNWYPNNKWIAAIVISFATFLAGIYQPTAPHPHNDATTTEEPAPPAEAAAG
ncbi:MAG TPA: hypothetical protein VHZ25_07715 [Acidobacteriaceae bacterium]|nr:hypothetical protein [Acidobacteriaceae bacterium]